MARILQSESRTGLRAGRICWVSVTEGNQDLLPVNSRLCRRLSSFNTLAVQLVGLELVGWWDRCRTCLEYGLWHLHAAHAVLTQWDPLSVDQLWTQDGSHERRETRSRRATGGLGDVEVTGPYVLSGYALHFLRTIASDERACVPKVARSLPASGTTAATRASALRTARLGHHAAKRRARLSRAEGMRAVQQRVDVAS